MESPPSSSTWSEAFILSDDSGLLLTNESASSSVSYESKSGRKIPFEFQDSDCEEKSLSQDDSFDGMSDVMCGENFNTLKKGRNWTYDLSKAPSSPIDPPPEFQDKPLSIIELFSSQLSEQILCKALRDIKSHTSKYSQLSLSHHRPNHNSQSLLHPQQLYLNSRPYWSPDFLSFSPCHMGRPSSRSSLGSSRLSSSHNSLSVPTAHRVDDSTFITQAVSHDTLSSNQISDLYNVPFDSDVYAVPIDVIKPPLAKNKRAQQQQQKKKRRNTTSYGYRELELKHQGKMGSKKNTFKGEWSHWAFHHDTKRHSVAGTSASPQCTEPIHMTLQEVRQYLQTLYSSSSDSSEQQKDKLYKPKSIASTNYSNNNNNNNYKYSHRTLLSSPPPTSAIIGKEPTSNKNTTSTTINNLNTNNNMNNNNRVKKNTFLINIKNKKVKDSCDTTTTTTTAVGGNKQITNKSKDDLKQHNNNRSAPLNNNNNIKAPTKLFSFKQALCNMFRFKRILSPEHVKAEIQDKYGSSDTLDDVLLHSNNISSRALPPLPKKFDKNDAVGAEEAVIADSAAEASEEQALDFATSIQRVKDYGWYWGPISSEAAEKVLSNEPDGSFLVRDSSDDHYIFSLTFKLNNCVRHVRIEHDQGNFSFGSCTKFKSQTIVEFIENAVEHSRSGRYLFFLHRRPVIGPVRVQLLHPVSRFKQVQSLQHMCRFVIHKMVRRDLIPSLPLPRRIIDYLNTPHYYAEHFVDIGDQPEEVLDSNAADNEDTNSNVVNNGNMIENNNVQNANPNVPVTNNYIIINNTSNTRQS